MLIAEQVDQSGDFWAVLDDASNLLIVVCYTPSCLLQHVSPSVDRHLLQSSDDVNKLGCWIVILLDRFLVL